MGKAHPANQADHTNRSAGSDILAVTEEELRRIILDIHDGAAQQLFAALAQVSAMQKRLAGGETIANVEWQNHLQRQAALLSSAQNEIRNFMGTFRPPDFPRRTIVDMLQGLILQHENFTGCEVDLIVDAAPSSAALPVKIALYRICQEALANAYRHSGARQQTVRLACEGGVIMMEVVDNGRGFTPSAIDDSETGAHIGLRGMRERLTLVNGSLEINSAPGQGARICVRVPAHG